MSSASIFSDVPKSPEDIFDKYFDSTPIVRMRMHVPLGIGQGIFVITEGIVEIFVPLNRATTPRVRFGRLGKYDFFGEIGYLRAYGEPDVRSAEALAIKVPLKLRRLRDGPVDDPYQTLRDLLQEYPRIAVNMLSEMARRLAAKNLYVYPDADDRTRLALIRMSRCRKTPVLTTSASEIAYDVGYTGQAVRNALRALESDDIIKITPLKDGLRVEIVNLDRLAEGLLFVD